MLWNNKRKNYHFLQSGTLLDSSVPDHGRQRLLLVGTPRRHQERPGQINLAFKNVEQGE